MPSDLLRQTEQLSADVTRPISGSRKVHVTGSRPELRVPMREVVQSQTPTLFGGEENPPITVYDTSGPYSDPDACIDMGAGLAPLRATDGSAAVWVVSRRDARCESLVRHQFQLERSEEALGHRVVVGHAGPARQ